MKYNFDEIINRQNTNCVKYDLNQEIFGTNDILPMWVADMDFKTPDFIIDAVKERAEHPVYGYTFRPDSYYQSIIDWVKRRNNWNIDKEWIGFCPGIVPAVNMAVMAFSNPGDKIIVQPPVYFPFFNAVELNGRRLVYNQLQLKNGRYGFDLEDLKKKTVDPAVKMLILSNPHNPGGSVWSKTELEELATICIENNVLIISDEIHGDLVYKPNKYIPLSSIYNEIAQHTVSFIAPSKTFNIAGMSSASSIISNKVLRQRYNEIIEQLHIGMGNMFGIVALEAAYKNGDNWLNQLLEYLQENVKLTQEFIESHIPEIKMIKPEGTYLVWLDFSKLGLNNKELDDLLIKKAKVGLNSGYTFGPGGDGFMRINIACPKPILEKALKQIKEVVKQLK